MVAFTITKEEIVDETLCPKLVLSKPEVLSKKQNQHGDKK